MDELRSGIVSDLSNSYFFLLRKQISIGSGWFDYYVGEEKPFVDTTWVEKEIARVFSSAFLDWKIENVLQRQAAARQMSRTLSDATFNGVWDGSKALSTAILDVLQTSPATYIDREPELVRELSSCFVHRADGVRESIRETMQQSRESDLLSIYLSGRVGIFRSAAMNEAVDKLRYALLAESGLSTSKRTSCEEVRFETEDIANSVCALMKKEMIKELQVLESISDGHSERTKAIIGCAIINSLDELEGLETAANPLTAEMRSRCYSSLASLLGKGFLTDSKLVNQSVDLIVAFLVKTVAIKDLEKMAFAETLLRTIYPVAVQETSVYVNIFCAMGFSWLRGRLSGHLEYEEFAVRWLRQTDSSFDTIVANNIRQTVGPDRKLVFVSDPLSSMYLDYLYSWYDIDFPGRNRESIDRFQENLSPDVALGALEFAVTPENERGSLSERAKSILHCSYELIQ